MSPSKIYGLIGYPVKHSFSPAMHNAAFSFLKLNARYQLFPLKPQELKDFFSDLKKNNICGLNVTIPYKETVIPFLNTLSEEARLIGAVNTIKVSDTQLEGFNTDGEGFLRHLEQDLKFDPQGQTVALIGAGGAARAIAVYLAKKSPRGLTIYDIDKTKALTLINHLKENFTGIEFKHAESIEGLNIQKSSLLINATPMGMKDEDPCVVHKDSIPGDILVYDLIYNRKVTKLLQLAKEKGVQVSNGLGMLLYQGVGAFELWMGQEAPVEIMRKALTEEWNK